MMSVNPSKSYRTTSLAQWLAPTTLADESKARRETKIWKKANGRHSQFGIDHWMGGEILPGTDDSSGDTS